MKTEELLKSTLANNFLSTRSSDFLFLEGASRLTIGKMTVNTTTDDNGNFGVFGEASLQAIGFKDTDLKPLLELLATKGDSGKEFRDLEMIYNLAVPDFARGEIKFVVRASGTLVSAIDERGLKDDLKGKSLELVKSEVAKVPGLHDADVSVWPFWLRSLPGDSNKIKVSIQ